MFEVDGRGATLCREGDSSGVQLVLWTIEEVAQAIENSVDSSRHWLVTWEQGNPLSPILLSS